MIVLVFYCLQLIVISFSYEAAVALLVSSVFYGCTSIFLNFVLIRSKKQKKSYKQLSPMNLFNISQAVSSVFLGNINVQKLQLKLVCFKPGFPKWPIWLPGGNFSKSCGDKMQSCWRVKSWCKVAKEAPWLVKRH